MRARRKSTDDLPYRPKADAPDEASSHQFAPLDDWSPELLKSRAYEQLLLDIITGTFAPGARIEERALAVRCGCGLAGIRDALARLALEGLVQRRSRIGTLVAPLDLIQIKQAFEARFLIESHCAGLAAMHATHNQIMQIKTAFDGAEAAVAHGDFRKLITMDRNFHSAVAFASHNLELARMVINLHHKAARLWIYSMTTLSRQERLNDLALHRAVVRAIETGDVAGAQKAMLLVLGDFPGRVKRTLVRNNSSDRAGLARKKAR